ncbi:MAG: bifunctional diaminohydroxyphosphoribosylaminopyrimidine deaminase/5-amino-6-(5-phosphoribosylamino)uracil reductase RibD [Nakamurella sp.]
MPADAASSSASPAELAALSRACDLAARGIGTALPNPVVGCVLIAPDGSVVGEGFHQHVGGPHAEVNALAAAGDLARGSTAVVTLEPCNHTGRTGPCSEALLAAGVSRLVVAVRDPWATASGGIDRLRREGVDVADISESALDVVVRARDVNRVWLGAIRSGRPFVTLKIAMSIDGRVSAPDGSSRWISSPESRADAHRMRGEIDTIMVGVGTVLADDPALTARADDGSLWGRQPLRVVVDSHGRTPAGAKVLDAQGGSLIATAAAYGAGADGRVNLGALLVDLFGRGRRHLLVEGGPRLAASFIDGGWVDEVLVYLAPLVLGAGRSAVEGGHIETLADAHRVDLVETRLLGPDLALRYRVLKPEQ